MCLHSPYGTPWVRTGLPNMRPTNALNAAIESQSMSLHRKSFLVPETSVRAVFR